MERSDISSRIIDLVEDEKNQLKKGNAYVILNLILEVPAGTTLLINVVAKRLAAKAPKATSLASVPEVIYYC
jgi:hypothetical protein